MTKKSEGIRQNTIKQTITPYIKQFNRSPIHIKIIASVCLIYLAMPIDPFDILFPWLAWQDDILVATYLLKILHKYGSVSGETYKKPIEIIQEIRANRKQQD